MALSVEASELVEIFQWLTPKEAKEIMHFKKGKKAVRDELADILYYLIRISDKLGVDLEEAFWEKMKDNAKKYPIKKSKGLAKKYTAL